MKVLIPILVVIVLIGAVACGSDEPEPTSTPGPPTIDNATSCAALIDAFIPMFQEMLDGTKDLTEEVLIPGEQPAFLADRQPDFDRFDARQAELGCESDELDALFLEKSAVLTAEGPVAEWALEAFIRQVQE